MGVLRLGILKGRHFRALLKLVYLMRCGLRINLRLFAVRAMPGTRFATIVVGHYGALLHPGPGLKLQPADEP